MDSEKKESPGFAVLGYGEKSDTENILVLVDETERQGLPFHFLTRDIPTRVETLRQAGKKDYDIVRAMGFLAGGDCKFGFYLGMAEEDIHFFLSASFCYNFLREYGPGSDREKLIQGKEVKFLVCRDINFAEMRVGKPPSYTIAKTNANGKERPWEKIGFRDDTFYQLYVDTEKSETNDSTQ